MEMINGLKYYESELKFWRNLENHMKKEDG